jgi:pyruvate formate lyase activating enzyme
VRGSCPPRIPRGIGGLNLSSGIVFDIARYSIHDGPGIRTAVFLKGCPLRCWWCHNPEGISAAPEPSRREGRCVRCGVCVETCPEGAILWNDGAPQTSLLLCTRCAECVKACCAEAREIVGREMTVGQVVAEVLRDLPFYDESGGGVTFSGGEPLMQPEFLVALLDACGERGIHRVVDTCGHARAEVVERIAGRAELFLFDLKQMDPDLHRRYTGVGNDLILGNLGILVESGANVRVRLPLVPGVNDSLENVTGLGAFLKALGSAIDVDILPYHDVMIGKYRRLGRAFQLDGLARPSAEHVAVRAQILAGFGLHVTIRGEKR